MSAPSSEHHDVNVVTSLDPDCSVTRNQNVRASETVGCLITPFSGWSQDSNNSASLLEINPILDKLSHKSTVETPVKQENIWQLFNMDCDSDVGF